MLLGASGAARSIWYTGFPAVDAEAERYAFFPFFLLVEPFVFPAFWALVSVLFPLRGFACRLSSGLGPVLGASGSISGSAVSGGALDTFVVGFFLRALVGMGTSNSKKLSMVVPGPAG